MGVGAIVVVDAESEGVSSIDVGNASSQRVVDRPFAFVETLGLTPLERTVQWLQSQGVQEISILVHWDLLPAMPALRQSSNQVGILAAVDVSFQVALTLKEYAEKNLQQTFLVNPNLYCESELMEMFDFHRDTRSSVTRATDPAGRLDLWLVDSEVGWQYDSGAERSFLAELRPQEFYFVKQYCKPVHHARDLRQLATDALSGRSRLRPFGKEIEPNVWVDDGAQIDRSARIDGPTYVGRACTVGERTLVTECSSIESYSYIDYGTEIENATILPNTYVGVGLDVRHCVTNANRVCNLMRDVLIEIEDPSLFRSMTNECTTGTAKLALMKLLKRSGAVETSAELHAREREQECFTNLPPVNTRTEFES